MKALILAGLPGSGKSTFRASLQGLVISCSADDWFLRNGVYTFNPRELGNAHSHCLMRYLTQLRAWKEGHISVDLTVVVDNTNTTAIEMAPYVALAQAHEVPYEIRIFDCSPELSAKRNTHGVPLASCRSMHGRLQQLIKSFPGHWNKPTVVKVSDA